MDKWELSFMQGTYGAIYGDGSAGAYRIGFGTETKAMAEQHVDKLNEQIEPVAQAQYEREYEHRQTNLAARYYNMTQDRTSWNEWTCRDRDRWIKDYRESVRIRAALRLARRLPEPKVWSAEVLNWCPL